MKGEFKVAVTVKLRLGLFGNAVRLTRIPGLTISKLMFGLHLENSQEVCTGKFRHMGWGGGGARLSYPNY